MSTDTANGDLQIVVTVNGPGEVACWLYPLANELKRQMPHVRLCVAIVPCTFSSGTEANVLRSLPNVDAVCTIDETIALITRNRMPDGFRKRTGIVMHLGGDSMFTILLSKRLHVPAVAYVERPLAFQFMFDRVYYSGFEKIAGLKESEREKIVGEMMVDAAHLRSPDRSAALDAEPVVAMFPGSRMYLTKYVLPYQAAAAEMVAQKRPDVRWVISRSDFVNPDFLRYVPDVNDGRPLDGVNLNWRKDGDREFLTTPKGIEIEILSPAQVGARATLALTVPGSQTAELSALGVPMILTLPTYRMEVAPLPGIAGHVGRIPLIGPFLKRQIAARAVKSYKFFSHPNRRADRMVIPELVGKLNARQLADAIEMQLNADNQPLESELKSLMGPPGATKRVVSELADYLASISSEHEVAPAH